MVEEAVGNIYKNAREKYRPQQIKLLFITEAPPSAHKHRYFYYEKVSSGDSLFLEIMKVLFAEEVKAFPTTKSLRAEKTYFLERMQEEGYFLMNALDEPLVNKTTSARIKIYRNNFPVLIKEILRIAKPSTPIVLVSTVVFNAIGKSLKASGFNLIHSFPIEFPNSGQQVNFRKKLKPLLYQKILLPF